MKKLLYILLFILPVFMFSQQEIEICEGDDVTFTYSTSSNQMGSISWFLNNVLVRGGTNLTIDWGEYPIGIYDIIVTFNSINNCPSEPVYFQVTTKECDQITMYVPNSFSPNGDNLNEIWLPKGFNTKDVNFYVMNRWGNLVFTSNSLDTGWDGTYQGKMCQEDTYIYILKWKDRRGRQYIDHGHLTLIK